MVNVANVMKNAGVSSYQAADELRRLNEALVWEKRQSELNRRTIDWNVQKDRVGKYKGYEVVRIDKKTYEELLGVNQIRADVFYVIADTNQVVYIDKVIGEFNFVNENIMECEAYDYCPIMEKKKDEKVVSTTGEYEGYMQTVNDFFKGLVDPLANMG